MALDTTIPELGTFISPDTLVPDPSNVLDYNRYMHTRGNPLKYNDPTGHCASNEDGSPNLVGADNEHCWGLVEQIYGYSGLPSFQADWKIPPQQWRETIANQEYATSEYLQPFADQYATEWRLWESAAGLSLATPRVLGDYNVTVHMPGQDMVGIVVDDVIECKRSWQDCGRVLDDASTALSSVAVGCGVTGFAPCAGVAAGTSTALSVVGTGLTIYGAWQGKSTWLDVGVATFTTGVGATVGAKPSDTQVVGFIISVAQWAWDH